jgi:hypothetical protein
MLVQLRAKYHDQQPWYKRTLFKAWAWAMRHPRLYAVGQRAMREMLPNDAGWAPRGLGPLADWTKTRDLKLPAARSFRTIWREELRDEE